MAPNVEEAPSAISQKKKNQKSKNQKSKIK